MKLLIFIIAVVHAQGFNSHRFFRTRLSKQPNILNKHENISNKRLQSMKSLNYHYSNNKCNQPCQRQPYFVTFDSIMEYAHIHKLVGRSIRPGDGQYMVDVGICSGFCTKFQTFLYTDIPVSSTQYTRRSRPTYKPQSIKSPETRCIPISFESLNTDILINGLYEPGPRLENSVVKDCACSTIDNCF